MTIYTIGHGNIAVDRFLSLLSGHTIDALIDTRSQPYSRYAPQFNREALNIALRHAGIGYRYLGDRLGGRPRDAWFYGLDGDVDYDRLSQAAFYQGGIEHLNRGAEARRLAVLCSEAGYKNCHRYKLITRTLVSAGLEVYHILHSGGLDPTDLNDFHPQPRQLSLPLE
jgi:uncharacterized protein (DUF488 family)